MDSIEDRSGHCGPGIHSNAGQHGANSGNHQIARQPADIVLAERAQRAGQHRCDGDHGEDGAQKLAFFGKDHHMDTQEAINRDLGEQTGKQGGHRDARRVVGRRQARH